MTETSMNGQPNDFTDMRAFVTGCAGFIGSWITDTLIQQGAIVCGLDNFETSKRENIAHLEGKFQFI